MEWRNPTIVRGPGGQEIALEDSQGNRPLYSSCIFGSNQSVDSVLFRYSKGEKVTGANNSAVNADERHTNCTYSGVMADSDDMTVYSIAVEFEADIPQAALLSLMDDIYGEFYSQSERVIYDGLARHFPGGSGIGGYSNVNAAQSLSNGEPNANTRTVLNVPIKISPNKKFRWNWRIPGGSLALGTADQLCRVIFRGFRTVAV